MKNWNDILQVEKVSGIQFREYFLAYLARNPHQKPFVTVFDAEHYRFCECFVSHDCACGFAIQEDEIISLFAIPGRGTDMLLRAKERGGCALFCFDGHLRRRYERAGFIVESSAPWDESLAPDSWDYARYGRPDVVWMRLPSPSFRPRG